MAVETSPYALLEPPRQTSRVRRRPSRTVGHGHIGFGQDGPPVPRTAVQLPFLPKAEPLRRTLRRGDEHALSNNAELTPDRCDRPGVGGPAWVLSA